MPSQENKPTLPEPTLPEPTLPESALSESALSGDGGGRTTVYAGDALKGVERVRERARVEAGRVPAWYGPAVAVTLVLPSAVQAWSQDRGGWPVALALLVSLLGLAAVFALVRAARRSAGVRMTRSLPSRLSRSRIALPAVLAAGLVAGACCWAAGAGAAATRITAFAVWGLGVWGVCLVRNAAIDRALRQLA